MLVSFDGTDIQLSRCSSYQIYLLWCRCGFGRTIQWGNSTTHFPAIFFEIDFSFDNIYCAQLLHPSIRMNSPVSRLVVDELSRACAGHMPMRRCVGVQVQHAEQWHWLTDMIPVGMETARSSPSSVKISLSEGNFLRNTTLYGKNPLLFTRMTVFSLAITFMN